jgi:hypothetical protein
LKDIEITMMGRKTINCIPYGTYSTGIAKISFVKITGGEERGV